MAGNERRDESTGGGAGDDSWEETAEEEGLDNAEVDQPEQGTALKYQRRPAKRLPRVVYQVQLGLRWQVWRVVEMLVVVECMLVRVRRMHSERLRRGRCTERRRGLLLLWCASGLEKRGRRSRR